MKRICFTVGGGLFVGCLLVSVLPFPLPTLPLILLAIAIGLLLLLSVLFKQWGMVLLVLAVTVGMGRFALQEIVFYKPSLVLADTTQMTTATVLSRTDTDADTAHYRLETYTIGVEERTLRVLLFASNKLQAEVGDELTIPLYFFLPSHDVFDGISYYKTEDIYLLAYGDEDEAVVTPNPSPMILHQLQCLNTQLSDLFATYLPSSEAAVVQSMLLGDRTGLTDLQQHSYRLSGTSHLFSISGLHLSVIAGAILLLLRPFGRRIGGIVCLPVLLFFILFSGMSDATIRSGIMVTLLFLGVFFHQRVDGLNSLGLAATLLLLVDPYAILDLGFLASFGATFGIVFLYPTWIATCAKWKIWQIAGARWAVSGILVSVAATLPLLPLYVTTFGFLNLFSPISNLILLPIATMVLLLSFLVAILLPFTVPTLLLSLLQVLAQLQNTLAEKFASFDQAIVGLDEPVFHLAVAILTTLFLLYFMFTSLWGKKVCLLCMTLVVCVTILSSVAMTGRTVLYSVGDGRCTNLILLDRGHCTVISMEDDNYIDKRTVDFLLGKGVTDIDHLILGYRTFSAHRDTTFLLEACTVGQVWLHEENLEGRTILSQVSTTELRPITDRTILDQGDVTTTVDYADGGMWINLSLYGTPVAIATATQLGQMEAAVYFYKWQPNGESIPYPSTSWLLTAWEDGGSVLQPAYDRTLTFVFDADGTFTIRENID